MLVMLLKISPKPDWFFISCRGFQYQRFHQYPTVNLAAVSNFLCGNLPMLMPFNHSVFKGHREGW
jgi:hypothetical protein